MIADKGQYLIVWDERWNRGRELNCFETPEYGDIPVAVREKERFWSEEIEFQKKTGKNLMSLPKEEFFAYWGKTCPKPISKIESIKNRLARLKDDIETIDAYGSCSYSFDKLAKEIEYMVEDLSEIKQENKEELWISLDKKKPRAGCFVLMKNDEGFIAYACRRTYGDKEVYYIRQGQNFVNPTAWTSKERLLSH